MSGQPIQLYCVISTVGDFTPIKFKYKDPDGVIQTVDILSVLSRSRIRLDGSEMLCLRCRATCDNAIHHIELRYDIGAHKWVYGRSLDQLESP